jgi:hypothetical protein
MSDAEVRFVGLDAWAEEDRRRRGSNCRLLARGRRGHRLNGDKRDGQGDRRTGFLDRQPVLVNTFPALSTEMRAPTSPKQREAA